VAALLMKRHGFDGLSALAWIRLAHPASAQPPLSFSLPSTPSSDGRSGLRRAQRFSGSAPALLLAEPPTADGRAGGHRIIPGFGRGLRGDLTVATVLAAAAAAASAPSAEVGGFRLGPEVKLGWSVSAVGLVELLSRI
jgi:hypothetical protein